MGILDWWLPREQIDYAPDFNYDAYIQVSHFLPFLKEKYLILCYL
jgi:hypothetical protein